MNVAMAQFDFCIGPKIGYQAQTLSLKKADIEREFKNSFTAGVFGRLTIKNFIIQPELLYFKTGKVINFDFQELRPSLTLNQSNLALPILLGYQFFDAKLLKIRGNVGPVMYFVVGQDKDDLKGLEPEAVEDLKAKNMTWGAMLNVGIDVWRLTLDINYSFGLTNLFKKDSITLYNPFTGDPGTFDFDDAKQNIFTVTLGFKLL